MNYLRGWKPEAACRVHANMPTALPAGDPEFEPRTRHLTRRAQPWKKTRCSCSVVLVLPCYTERFGAEFAPLKRHLSIDYEQDLEHGTVALSQTGYIESIYERFMPADHAMRDAKPPAPARKELSAIATKKCDAHLAAFSRCAQEQNLMVVFNCREENRKMNACLSQYTNEAAFEEYKLRRSIELAKQGKKGGA